MTPLVEPNVVRAALATPLSLKNLGRLEAALIRRVDPKLAAYPSAYGFAFDQAPSMMARFSFALTVLRPPQLRRYSFASSIASSGRFEADTKRRSMRRLQTGRLLRHENSRRRATTTCRYAGVREGSIVA